MFALSQNGMFMKALGSIWEISVYRHFTAIYSTCYTCLVSKEDT